MTARLITFSSREEWLKERTRIGGSDASSVLGLNPYKDNQELWETKTGKKKSEDISDKPYVRYGTEAEDYLRELFKLDFLEYEVDYLENNMFLNDRYPFAHASLDGWLTDRDGRKGVLEIKTTEILRSMQREKWKGQIPDNYYVQLLHNLMVTEFDFAVLKAQLKYQYTDDVFLHTRHYFVERSDVEEDIKMLTEEEARWWKYVEADERPPLVLPAI